MRCIRVLFGGYAVPRKRGGRGRGRGRGVGSNGAQTLVVDREKGKEETSATPTAGRFGSDDPLVAHCYHCQISDRSSEHACSQIISSSLAD